MLYFLQVFPADSTVLDNICNYTNLTAQHTDVGFWDLLAICIAGFSFVVAGFTLGYTKRTYKAQEATQYNTRKLDQEAQKSLLLDLLRHLYRNMVVTLTMEAKMKAENFGVYPSEEHLVKLKIPMENIHLEVFYGEEDKYTKMHDLYLKLRNYNTEIDIICRHFMDRTIDAKTKQRDLDTLKFKCGFLSKCILDTFKKIWNLDKTKDAMEQIKSSHANNVRGDKSVDENMNKDMDKYAGNFEGYETEISHWLNEDVQVESGQNSLKSEKIHMIKFEKDEE